MNYINKYLESIRQYSFKKTSALQQEMDGVRKSNAAISADLAQLRENLQRTHDDDARPLADLQQQVKQIISDQVQAHTQVESLERSLADTRQRQKAADACVESLEAKLQEERSFARDRIDNLQHSIADSEQRQKHMNAHIDSLEAKLEEGRTRHDASIHATETSLASLQDEQQSLLGMQSELAKTFHGVSSRLQDSLHVESEKPKNPSQIYLVIAGVLLIATTLTALYTIQNRNQDIAAMKQDMREMREFMKKQIASQDTTLSEITLAVNKQTADNRAIGDKNQVANELEAPEVAKQSQNTSNYTPDIQELQANLIELGFDLGIPSPDGKLGIKTKQALEEFKKFYLPDSDAQYGVVSESLAAQILKSADLTKADSARFNIDNNVLAAIRLGSIRTGVDFSFLMEMAKVESNFDPSVRAPRSSATGLFQFKDRSWLEAIRDFGDDYGLEDYATHVNLIDDDQQLIVRDPLQLEVLALRLNPRLSALMAAENIKRNLRMLSDKSLYDPGRTELYLSHYFGVDGAEMFLKTLEEEPDAIAKDLFPQEAASNPGVFQNYQNQPRTVAGVYGWFDSKFNTTQYD